jgi:hypothetical protein
MKDGKFWKDIAKIQEAKTGGLITPEQDLEEWTKTFREVKSILDGTPMMSILRESVKSGDQKAIDESRGKYMEFINKAMNARGFVGAFEMKGGKFWKDIAKNTPKTETKAPKTETKAPEIEVPDSSNFFNWEGYQRKNNISVPKKTMSDIESDVNSTWATVKSALEKVFNSFKFELPIRAQSTYKIAISQSRRYIMAEVFRMYGLPYPFEEPVQKVEISKFIEQLKEYGSLTEDLTKNRKDQQLRQRSVGERIPGFYEPPPRGLKTFLEDRTGYITARRKAYNEIQGNGKINRQRRDAYMTSHGYVPLSHRLFGSITIDQMLRSTDKINPELGAGNVIAKIPPGVTSLLNDPMKYISKYRLERHKVLKEMTKQIDTIIPPGIVNEKIGKTIKALIFDWFDKNRGDADFDSNELAEDIFDKIQKKHDVKLPKDLLEDLIKAIAEIETNKIMIQETIAKFMERDNFYDPYKIIIGTMTSADLLKGKKPGRPPPRRVDSPDDDPDIYEDE